MSPLQQITYRLLIQPSHLIEDIHLAPTNRNQVVKTEALCTTSSASACSLTLRFLINMPCILLQLGGRNQRYVDDVDLPKRIRVKEIT